MHTMMFTKDRADGEHLWTVGYFEPTDDGGEIWHPLLDFSSERDAARYVNYLNGGTGAPFAWEETS